MIITSLLKRLPWLLLGTVAACGSEADTLSVIDWDVEWQKFRLAAYREPFENGQFIVDGDIPILDEKALRTYYFKNVARVGQPLTVLNVLGTDITWPEIEKFELSYCISDSFGVRKDTVISGMAAAANSWSDRVAVRFRYNPNEDVACNASNMKVLFDVNPVNASYFARAFFPDSARPQRNVLITESAFTTNAGGVDFEGILRHELGHTLGFRHEHIWISCTTEPTDESRQVTDYDVNSVMHYPWCRPMGAGGLRQTEKDYQGANSLYGLAPALTLTSIGL